MSRYKNTTTKKTDGKLNMAFQPSHFTYEYVKRHLPGRILFLSNSIIVSKFTYKPQIGKGRSGQGKMEKGGSWRISPTYAGTLQDNFITRALQSKTTVKAISKVIQDAIKKNWD